MILAGRRINDGMGKYIAEQTIKQMIAAGTVNAPPPEKYALHKLLVYGERPQNMRVKASKDLDQAASLIAYLGKHDAGLLGETWEGLISRGPGWKSRAIHGLVALKERYPDLDTSALTSG